MQSTDLNMLVALDALLSEGSVSAAAERMHLSAPAMSHALARIREALGDPLLVRAGRGLTPTPRALALREPVRQIVAQARALLQPEAGPPLEQVRREFVLRAPDTTHVVYGAALLRRVQARMPQASLRFVPEGSGDAMALRDGRIDIDLGHLRDTPPEVIVEHLFEQRFVGAARGDHPLAASRITLKRLIDLPHVAVTQRDGERDPLDAALAALGVRRQVALTVPSAFGALLAVSQTDCIAVVSARTAENLQQQLGLHLFKLPFEMPALAFAMAWHPRHDADEAQCALRECLKQTLLGGTPVARFTHAASRPRSASPQ